MCRVGKPETHIYIFWPYGLITMFTVSSVLSTPSPPPLIYYLPFQGDASVVVYSNCQCLSVFYLFLTYCSIYLGEPCGQLLGKSCLLGFSLVLFLFWCRLDCRCPFPVLVFRTGCGIRLYRFLFIAFLSTGAVITSFGKQTTGRFAFRLFVYLYFVVSCFFARPLCAG